ncbi:hypothetical protein NGM37_17670 [Streptomyces sp. TRM76130]|nr:hypothetical protein [Streptomyces sp. TRM76130]
MLFATGVWAEHAAAVEGVPGGRGPVGLQYRRPDGQDAFTDVFHRSLGYPPSAHDRRR